MLTPDHVRRLRFARLLLLQAVEHARIDEEARNAACVTSLQDAVETLLLIVAERVDASIPPRADFDKYFSAINEKAVSYTLPLQTHLMRLNRMRVQAKHAGIFPSHAHASEMVPLVTAFATEVCERLLDVNWATANLSALVHDTEQRGLLEDAEQALATKRYVDALVAARKCLFLAFEHKYDISRFASENPLDIFAAFGCEAPVWAKSSEYISKHVGDPFGYIVIDHPGLDAKLLKLGVDAVAFWNVWRITPAVYQLEDKTWVVKRELAKIERPDHEGDAIYVVETVSEMILRREAHDRRLKMVPNSGLWHLTVKQGAKAYAKADRAAQVRNIFSESRNVTVVAETFGLNGEGGWWEVHWFGADAIGAGYLLEEDVQRP